MNVGYQVQQYPQQFRQIANPLAELVEVPPSQVLRWERDEYQPKARALQALAEQLELPSSELFGLAGIRADALPKPTIPAMLRADYDLPPEAIAEIEAHIAKVADRYRSAKTTTETNPTRKEGDT